MQSPVKIGYLFPFIVVKKLPDHNCYLVNLVNTELFAQLPKNHAVKEYRVGETGWAAIFQVKGARITISQKSPQYIRKMFEYFLNEPLSKHELQIKKIAIMRNFFKVLIKTEKPYTNKELDEIFAPHIRDSSELRKYFPEGQFVFVKYYEKIDQLISSLLVYEDKINRVIYFSSLGQASVYAQPGYVGLIVGEKGKNLITTKKLIEELTGSNIDIEVK